MKLNKKDSKLLHSLAQNSRATLKELSESSGYSQESVQKKIQEFIQLNIINSYSTQINIQEAFNLQEYIGFLQVWPTNNNEIEKLISFLEQSKFTSWIGRGIGAFDIKISIFIQYLEQINDFEQILHSTFPTLIKSIEWNQIISKHKNSSNTIISNCLQEHQPRQVQTISSQDPNPKLHSIQIQMLYLLSNNSRLSLQELSSKLNTTIENAHYHFKKLQKASIIKQFSVVLNTSYFNKHATILLLKMYSSQTSQIISKLLLRENVTSILEVIGTYNIQVTMLHDSTNSMFVEINSIIDEFSQTIIETQHFFIYSFYKYPKLPRIILEI